MNAFAADLYRELAPRSDSGDISFSPYSVQVALAMAAEGARGATAREMLSVLHLTEDEELRHTALLRLRQRVEALGRTSEGAPLWSTYDSLAAARSALDDRSRQLAAEMPLETAGEPGDRGVFRHRYVEKLRLAQRRRELDSEMKALFGRLRSNELSTANAIWIDSGFRLGSAYRTKLDQYFGLGSIQVADFASRWSAERIRINRWVELATRGRIGDLLPPGALSSATAVVLVNTIYLRARWKTPFDRQRTTLDDFHLAGGGTTVCPLMVRPAAHDEHYAAFNADGSFFATPAYVAGAKDDTRYYPEGDGFAMVELPYQGGMISMVLVAPNRPEGLRAVEGLLESGALLDRVREMPKRDAVVYLPRFGSETEYSLKTMLQALGMRSAFEPSADFSGMIDSGASDRPLWINLVQHRALVKVDEEGTEAAAATAVEYLSGFAGGARRPFIPVFRADRPFLYLIRDVRSGAILFLGRVMKPESFIS